MNQRALVMHVENVFLTQSDTMQGKLATQYLIRCANCNYVNPWGSQFCINCGSALLYESKYYVAQGQILTAPRPKNHILRNVLVVVGVVFIILAVIATNIGFLTNEPEYINISGIGQRVTVNSPRRIILNVSGSENIVTVSYGVEIVEINLSGVNNTVHIPRDSNPKVNISGIGNTVARY